MFQRSVGLLSYLVFRWKSTWASSKGDPPKYFPDLFRIQGWPDYDRFLRGRRDEINKRKGTLDVGCGLAWIGQTFVQHQKLVDAVCRCLRDIEPQVALEAVLSRMNHRRADSVRRVQRKKSNSGQDSPQVRRTLTQDLIVSHALEHFSEKIEQAHMSAALLQQRLNLFLKINEGRGISHEVECPVNENNVALINRGVCCLHLSSVLLIRYRRYQVTSPFLHLLYVGEEVRV